MAPIVLGYWNIRGLGQPIRYMLGYLGEDFEEIIYGKPPLPEWHFDAKGKIDLDFPNLPYLYDGDIKLTQSNAILRHLGRKHNMVGKTEKEKARVDLIASQGMDFRNGFIRLCYESTPENFEENTKVYKTKIKALLKKFDKFVGDGPFFAGEELTFVDFFMYEILDHHRIFDAALLEPCENINAFMKRFEEIPKIAAFMQSDKCFRGIINAPWTQFY